MAVSAKRRRKRQGALTMKILQLELKRVLKAKLTWILLTLALLFSIVLAYLPVTYCYSHYTDETGREINLTGLASIAHEKERQSGAAGVVTPERVRDAVEAYQACLTAYGVTESYDLPDGVYQREILPISPLLHGVKEAFADPDTGMAPSIMEIDPEQLDDYYSVCEARITSLMAMEMPGSPAAQRAAAAMYRQVAKPFEVYPGMSSNIMDYQNIMGFLVLLFCVVIAAPVFSADYQSGADDIFRCTRYGRAPLASAKLLASLFISGAAFIICAAAYIVTANSLFGWECTKTSIQMVYSIVTLADMSIGKLQLFFAAAGLLSVLASVSFTLFLSSRCKSAVMSLAAALAFCIAPAVISMTFPGALSGWVCSILPASGTSIQASVLYALTDFQFLNLGGPAVWTPYAMITACVIEIPLFSWLAVHSYCKHTVN